MPPKRPSQREASVHNAIPTAPFSAGVHHDERGTILAVDANRHIYHVATNTGRELRVGRLKSHPNDMSLLPARTPVLVCWVAGLPYIAGVLPAEVEENNDVVPQSVTDVDGHGGNDPVLSQSYGVSARAPDEPRDLLPGDAALLSPDGASLAALQGRIAQVKGGPLAKLQAFGEDDLVTITAGLFRLVTWMGESRVENNDGKTSYIWRGGTDQLTQTGPDESRWTIRLDVGHTGDVVKFEVCDRTGRSLFRFHVNAEGACELFAAGGMNQYGGSAEGQEHPQRFQGTRTTEISGRDEVRVAGAVSHVYESSRTYEVGGDADETVVGNFGMQVGGNREATVTGNDVARVNGSATWAVRGSTQFNADGGYGVKTLNNTIRLDPGTGQTVIETGGAMDGVKLGTRATSHAVKYEQLAVAVATLGQKLDVAMALIASHGHVVTGAAAAPAPSLTPITTPLPADITSAKATQVLIE